MQPLIFLSCIIHTMDENAQLAPPIDYHSNVDTSRPFSSVKEAVTVFGERFLAGEIYSPKPFTFPKLETPWKFSPLHEKARENADIDEQTLSLKKLEAELEETKTELKILKERESETEMALAFVNAELQKSMSKMAQFEAERATCDLREEDRSMVRMEISPTLDQIMSNIGDKQHGGRKKVTKSTKKKKPIIPLVGDLFSRRKGSPAALRNPLYLSPHMYT